MAMVYVSVMDLPGKAYTDLKKKKQSKTQTEELVCSPNISSAKIKVISQK